MPKRFPEDIKYAWLNVVRRMQSCVRIVECPGIVTIRVIVDENGTPVRWLPPVLASLEPKNAPLDHVSRLLPGEEL